MKNALLESTRMDRLNAAFSKRTIALAEYRKQMGLIRTKLKTAGEQLNTCLRDLIERQEELSRQAKPDAQLLLEIHAEKEQMDVYRVLMDQHREEMDAADAQRMEDLANIDKEITSLGGNLTLPKVTE